MNNERSELFEELMLERPLEIDFVSYHDYEEALNEWYDEVEQITQELTTKTFYKVHS